MDCSYPAFPLTLNQLQWLQWKIYNEMLLKFTEGMNKLFLQLGFIIEVIKCESHCACNYCQKKTFNILFDQFFYK